MGSPTERKLKDGVVKKDDELNDLLTSEDRMIIEGDR